jgi:hypothetical protein
MFVYVRQCAGSTEVPMPNDSIGPAAEVEQLAIVSDNNCPAIIITIFG